MSIDAPTSPILDEDGILPVSDLDHALRDIIAARRQALTRQRDVLKGLQRRVGPPSPGAPTLLDRLGADTLATLLGR